MLSADRRAGCLSGCTAGFAAFLAGLLHKLCSDPDLLQASSNVKYLDRINSAVRYANASGALVCNGLGAIDPQPIDSEVQKFLYQQLEDKQTNY